jgi:peptidoglycan/LPS O-acetylase OafA/YrhL
MSKPTRQNGTPVAGTKRVPLLDLLRFAAIMGVAAFHYGFLGPPGIGMHAVAIPALAPIGRYGYLGVPVFFMISGFVIAYSAENKTALEFAVARFIRIYPTFLLCMTLSCIVTVLIGAPKFSVSFSQWAANLFIAAPAFGRPYVDLVYWSLILEVTFYAWVAALLALNLFPRKIDALVATWLAITFLNELTIDAVWVEKIFMSGYSGYFATGLMIYEFHKGRRDLRMQALLALSVGCSVFLAFHKVEWLREYTQAQFDDTVVASIIVMSSITLLQCTKMERLPLRSTVVLAIGGVTYPFYLLHQQIGYDLLHRLDVSSPTLMQVAAILLGILMICFVIWRWFEQPVLRWARLSLYCGIFSILERVQLPASRSNSKVQ